MHFACAERNSGLMVGDTWLSVGVAARTRKKNIGVNMEREKLVALKLTDSGRERLTPWLLMPFLKYVQCDKDKSCVVHTPFSTEALKDNRELENFEISHSDDLLIGRNSSG